MARKTELESVPIARNSGVLVCPSRFARGVLGSVVVGRRIRGRGTKKATKKEAKKKKNAEPLAGCRRRIQRTGSEVNKIFLPVGVYTGPWPASRARERAVDVCLVNARESRPSEPEE